MHTVNKSKYRFGHGYKLANRVQEKTLVPSMNFLSFFTSIIREKTIDD